MRAFFICSAILGLLRNSGFAPQNVLIGWNTLVDADL